MTNTKELLNRVAVFEKAILEQVRAFEAETGMAVRDISIERVAYVGTPSEAMRVLTDIYLPRP